MTECRQCPRNTYSLEGAGFCTTCPKGSLASEDRSKCGNVFKIFDSGIISFSVHLEVWPSLKSSVYFIYLKVFVILPKIFFYVRSLNFRDVSRISILRCSDWE